MRCALAGLVVALLLTSCLPQIAGTGERDGEVVRLTVAVDVPHYHVQMIVHEATTDDPRCEVLAGTDLGCTLGTISPGQPAEVVVRSPPGALSCTVFGYVSEQRTPTAYRAVACQLARSP